MLSADKNEIVHRKAPWRWLGQIDSFCLLGVGLVLVGEGLRLMGQRQELGIGGEKLGPDIYMLVVGILILVSVTLDLFRGRAVTVSDSTHHPVLAILRSSVLLIGYISAMLLLGFTVSTFLFLISYAVWAGRQQFLRALIFAVAVTSAYCLIFYAIAGIVLPRGLIGF